MKTLPVRHLTAFHIETNLILRRLSVRVAGEQYDCNPDPHKPEAIAVAEALEALEAKVKENHGDGYNLSVMPAMTVEESTRSGNGGFPI